MGRRTVPSCLGACSAQTQLACQSARRAGLARALDHQRRTTHELVAAAIVARGRHHLAFVHAAYASGDPVVDEYRKLRATYAVGVVFNDGAEHWVHLTLSADAPGIARTEGRSVPADAGHRIVASALTAWAAREKSYFYLRAFSRQWSMLYTLSGDGSRATVEPTQPQDLLAYYLLRKATGAELAIKLWLDHQLAQHAPAGQRTAQ
jgi:hypothetical protein